MNFPSPDGQEGEEMEAKVEVGILRGAPRGASEELLIRQTQWGAIREMKARGMGTKAIARRLELDPKTVRKWLKQEWRKRRRSCDHVLEERAGGPCKSAQQCRGKALDGACHCTKSAPPMQAPCLEVPSS